MKAGSRSFLPLPLSILLLAAFVSSLPAQRSGDTDECHSGLMEFQHFPGVGLGLCPPCFWTRVSVRGQCCLTFTGPLQDGVVPRMDVFCNSDARDLDADRELLRASVRVRLVERQAGNIKLVDEGFDDELGREMLVQTFTFDIRGLEQTAMAYHFKAPDGTVTVLLTHATSCIDPCIELVAKVLQTVVVDGEDGSGPWWPYLLVLLVLSGAAYGVYVLYRRGIENELRKGRVADVRVLEREEASKGMGEMVIGDGDVDMSSDFDLETGFKVLDLSKRKKDGGN